jgi:hypothetical protein
VVCVGEGITDVRILNTYQNIGDILDLDILCTQIKGMSNNNKAVLIYPLSFVIIRTRADRSDNIRKQPPDMRS